jgi:hypothetical protein
MPLDFQDRIFEQQTRSDTCLSSRSHISQSLENEAAKAARLIIGRSQKIGGADTSNHRAYSKRN